ncbi:MAG TPA: hypothetical protein VFD80_10345 [Flavobacteriaceae bacterium]|nr:hypothetical protein [Flavobacteriaceae bacterium]
MENLVEIDKLKELLGYKDYRSIERWCITKNIAILKLGRKKYCYKESLDDCIKREAIKKFSVKKINSINALETPVNAHIFVEKQPKKPTIKHFKDIINKYN